MTIDRSFFQFSLLDMLAVTTLAAVLMFAYNGIAGHVKAGVFDRVPTYREVKIERMKQAQLERLRNAKP